MTVIFMFWPSNRVLYYIAGGMSVVGLSSRIASNYLNCIEPTFCFSWNAVISTVIYFVGVVMLWRVWITDIGAWHRSKASKNVSA